jgi:hypothetical protein
MNKVQDGLELACEFCMHSYKGIFFWGINWTFLKLSGRWQSSKLKVTSGTRLSKNTGCLPDDLGKSVA